MSELPTRAPQPTLETAPFWDACAQCRLVLPRCDRCGTFIWYPRAFCPACASTDVSWVEVSGRGTVYSRTVISQGQGPYREAGPYVLAMVELDEGPRLLTNVVGCDPAGVAIGQRVHVVFDDAGEGAALPRFSPSS